VNRLPDLVNRGRERGHEVHLDVQPVLKVMHPPGQHEILGLVRGNAKSVLGNI
jgi:hypothetical protein